jgi:hypothetical protein
MEPEQRLVVHDEAFARQHHDKRPVAEAAFAAFVDSNSICFERNAR